MTLHDIAINNLRRRKSKALFILAGIFVGVCTAVVLISLVEGMKHDINHKLEMYGANILIVPKTENLSLSYGGVSVGGVSVDIQEIREEELEQIKTIKNAGNLAAVGPMILGAVTVAGHHILMAGVDFEAFNTLRPWWSIQGKMPDEEGAVIGADAARILKLQQGDKFKIGNKEIEVTGVLEATGSQDDKLIFAPLVMTQKLLDKEGRISMAEVAALCSGCPIPEMVKQISEVLPGGNVMAIQQVVKGRMETLNQFQKFSFGVSALVLLVGSLMVLITMMGSVKERTVEIGIFRAMGFRRSHVIRIILFEAAVISGAAGILGYFAGFSATKILLPFFTESGMSHVFFNPVIAVGALLLALFVGLASSSYPAFMASRLDPNEALRAL